MTLIDEVLQFSIRDLWLLKHIKGLCCKSGTLYWKRGNERTASISITVNNIDASPYIELNYKNNQTPIKYRVPLVSIPSNLGKGVVWFFICPSTGKRCRKLYLADQYFVSRFAFSNAMYEKQTKSHKARRYSKAFDKLFKVDELREKMYSKHFKTHYAGKPTKRYQGLVKKIRAGKQFSEREILTLLKKIKLFCILLNIDLLKSFYSLIIMNSLLIVYPFAFYLFLLFHLLTSYFL